MHASTCACQDEKEPTHLIVTEAAAPEPRYPADQQLPPPLKLPDGRHSVHGRRRHKLMAVVDEVAAGGVKPDQ